jgi:serine/threonine protein kinase
MGVVYLARHPRLPRQDALKILGGAISADPDYQERFIREADLAAALWHPNIVAVHDRGESDGQLWIAMDYVEGEDASVLMGRRYPAGMPYEDVVEIVHSVADALDYAHDRGLVHRDVKPSNIMISASDNSGRRRILLSDFGIARTVGEVSGLTATNMTVGTVAYSAPEQLLGLDLDGRADQYAPAATAYHLLTGSPVFPDSNPAVVIGRHLSLDPPAPSTIRPELAAFDAAFTRALAKNPEDRFSRCQDFARALAEVTIDDPGLGSAAVPSGPNQQASVHTAEAVAAAAPTQLAPVRLGQSPTGPVRDDAPPRQSTSTPPSGRWLPAAAVVAGVGIAVAGFLAVRSNSDSSGSSYSAPTSDSCGDVGPTCDNTPKADGKYKVTKDGTSSTGVSPGWITTPGKRSDADECLWERLTTAPPPNENLQIAVADGHVYSGNQPTRVLIQATDTYFWSEGCQAWEGSR